MVAMQTDNRLDGFFNMDWKNRGRYVRFIRQRLSPKEAPSRQTGLSMSSGSKRRRPTATSPSSLELAAYKPQYDDDDQNDAKNPAEPATAIVAMCVITTSAAQQDDDEDDDENGAHGSASR
jgi:hypothetical protein